MKLINNNDITIKNIHGNKERLITITNIVREPLFVVENMVEQQTKNIVDELNFIEVVEDPHYGESEIDGYNNILEKNSYEIEGLSNLNPPDSTFFDENDKDFDPEEKKKTEPQEQLLENLKFAEDRMSEEEFNIAYAIAMALDEKGFFTTSNDDFIDTLKTSYKIQANAEIVENVRNFIANIGPLGSGSRDQIEHLVHLFIILNGISDCELKEKLLGFLNKDNILDAIKNHALLTEIGVENLYAELFSAFFSNSDNKRIITPYPFFTFDNIDTSREKIEYMSSKSAEAEIHVAGNQIYIIVDAGIYRKFHLNEKKYRDMYEKAQSIKDEETRKAEKNQILQIYRKSKDTIDGLKERRMKTKRILEIVIDRHRNHFLSKFQESMSHLTQQEIHEITGISVPSVSNTINEKYVKVFFDGESFGIFRIDHFITGADTLNIGKSQEDVIDTIRKLIDQENKANPLSDEKISQILGRNGIPIARKTVQKYREKAGVENSSKRRIR